MRKKVSLLAGGAVASVAIVLIGATPANAAVRHRHVAVRAAQSSEIQELKAEIAELRSRLDAQEEAQRSTQAQADAAQTQAVQAATQAQEAQTVAATASSNASTQVADAVAKLPKPKGGWFDNTSVSGRMYFDASNISQESNGSKAGLNSNGTGFTIKRFYLGVDHKFDDTFSGNITTDVSDVAGTTGNLVGRGLYIKKAYLQAKISPALIIRAGAADLPWIPYAENQYGYRHIENTLIDRISYGTSSDWGVHVLGDLANGIISYQVSVVDGGGYRNVKVSQSVDVEGRLSAQYKGVYGAIGGYTGKRANNTETVDTLHTASRLDAMVGYKNKMFGIGAEYFTAKDWNNVTTIAEDKADGYSIFGNVNFAQKFSAFGRYDWVKPNHDTNPDLKDHYFNVGIQYEPVKIVDIALVYKRDKADNGLISTQNGTIGGSVDGTYDEIGLFGQFRF